jgi:hypothetical protein
MAPSEPEHSNVALLQPSLVPLGCGRDQRLTLACLQTDWLNGCAKNEHEICEHLLVSAQGEQSLQEVRQGYLGAQQANRH